MKRKTLVLVVVVLAEVGEVYYVSLGRGETPKEMHKRRGRYGRRRIKKGLGRGFKRKALSSFLGSFGITLRRGSARTRSLP